MLEQKVYRRRGKRFCGQRALWWCSRYSDWLRAGQQRGQSLSPSMVKNFLFPKSRPAMGSTQPIQWVLGVKQRGHEADHSPQASAEVKKMWIHTSTPPYVLMA
jgi:hypothetical protein